VTGITFLQLCPVIHISLNDIDDRRSCAVAGGGGGGKKTPFRKIFLGEPG